MLISDGQSMTQSASLLKMIIGRDEIPFDRKHENVSRPFLRSEAVVFVTSNLTIANAMVNSFDRALLDRFFQIHFGNVPEEPPA